jgi:hypothetical protein
MKILCTFVLMVGLAATAHADLPFKKKPQEFTTHNPNDVAATLRDGTPVQRNDLALELGIYAPNPSNGAAKPNSPCVNFSHIEQHTETLRAGAENVVMLADSSECDSTYIVVFDRAPKSEWRHVQTVRLSARSKRPEVSFGAFLQPGIFEIVARHETSLDTGGAMQENFVLFKMLHDRVEVVFDAAEQSEITLKNQSAADTDNLRQTQTSTFSLQKSAANSAALFQILEKEVITDKKTTITRYRVWSWDRDLERFRPAPFDGGDAVTAPPPAKKPAAKPAEADAQAELN